MKKVLLIVALIVAYGTSVSTANAVVLDNSATTVVADITKDKAVAPEGDKDKKDKTEAKAEKAKTTDAKAKAEGCATAKADGCAAAKAAGCETAKASCCEGKAKSASAMNETKEKKQ